MLVKCNWIQIWFILAHKLTQSIKFLILYASEIKKFFLPWRGVFPKFFFKISLMKGRLFVWRAISLKENRIHHREPDFGHLSELGHLITSSSHAAQIADAQGVDLRVLYIFKVSRTLGLSLSAPVLFLLISFCVCGYPRAHKRATRNKGPACARLRLNAIQIYLIFAEAGLFCARLNKSARRRRVVILDEKASG